MHIYPRMINLLLSILFATSLAFILKIFERKKLDLFQAIVFNYLSCVITGIAVQQSVPDYSSYSTQSWFVYAVTLGCSFIFFFNVMGYIVKHMGITVMSVANKLSLVIPVSAAFFIFHEEATALKIIGIIIALCAVIFTSLKEESDKHTFKLAQLFWPILLFVGSGMNDTLIKYAQTFHMHDADNAPFNITIFSAAFAVGFLILVGLILLKKNKFDSPSIVGGLMLGVPNYFSMHFLIKALSINGYGGSVIFPLNNIGVVTVSAILAFFLFREKISKINLVGIALAIISIILIAYAA